MLLVTVKEYSHADAGNRKAAKAEKYLAGVLKDRNTILLLRRTL